MTLVTTNYELQKLIRMLPGYDPFAQAGDCYFDEKAAQFRIDFIQECCTFTQGEKAGQPFILEPWEKAIVANMYGWKHPSGLRRYRMVFVLVARGNGKSEMCAALICVGLFVPDDLPEPGGHVFSAAGKRDQTRYVFDPVCYMIRHSPEMSERARIYKQAINVGTRTYFPMCRETHTGTEHGGAPAFAVADEVHAHLDRRLITAIETGMVKRRQPLFVAISTADYEREGSPCNELQDYGRKVRDDTVSDPTFLPAIYEASLDDDWTLEETWAKANPNLGVSVFPENLQALCEKAKADPTFENEFRRLHCNVRTQQAFRLISMHDWDACARPIEIPEGAVVTIGLDGASTGDMASMVVCYNDGTDYHLEPYYFCPESQALEMQQRGDHTYVNWANEGLLEMTPGKAIDHRAIRNKLNELASRYDVQEVPFDPWNLRTFAIQVGEEDGIMMVEHRQGTKSMNEPMKLLVRMMLDGHLRHGGHPILRWNMSNLAARLDPDDNIRPDKANSGGKIDGAVAAIMAIGRAASLFEMPSFYETHGVEFAK